jgi:hypothetical protein
LTGFTRLTGFLAGNEFEFLRIKKDFSRGGFWGLRSGRAGGRITTYNLIKHKRGPGWALRILIDRGEYFYPPMDADERRKFNHEETGVFFGRERKRIFTTKNSKEHEENMKFIFFRKSKKRVETTNPTNCTNKKRFETADGRG